MLHGGISHIFLLLMHMANLEPNVLLGQGPRWILDYILKALEDGALALEI